MIFSHPYAKVCSGVGGCSIMNYCVDILEVDAHTQSYGGKYNNTYNSIRDLHEDS